MRLVAFLALASMSFSAFSAPPEGAGLIVVKASRMLDVRTGEYRADPVVTIQGDRIKSVDFKVAVIPVGAKVIDLGNMVLLPGLISCHEHLLGDMKDQSVANGLRTSSADGVLWGLHNLRIYLEHGFTTIRDAGESDTGYGQMALRNSINKGLAKGPRLLCAGFLISITGGHGDADILAPDQALPRRSNIADTVEQIGPAVRKDLKYGADWIKLAATGGVMDPISDYTCQELSQEQMAEAVAIAHRAHKKVMAHAEATEGIKSAVRAGVDTIEHGTMLDEEGAALMAQKGTWLVPTLYTFQHGAELGTSWGADPVTVKKTREILVFQEKAFSIAIKHHLKIAFGVDDDPDSVSKEFGALVNGGLSPLEALQAATVRASELLGMTRDIGTLEPGKFADLVALTGDPLKDISNMEKIGFVMKGGEVFVGAVNH